MGQAVVWSVLQCKCCRRGLRDCITVILQDGKKILLHEDAAITLDQTHICISPLADTLSMERSYQLFWCFIAFLSDAGFEPMHLAKSFSSLREGWKSTMPSNRNLSQLPCFCFSLPLQCTCCFGAPWPSTAPVLSHRDHGKLADCRHLYMVWAIPVECDLQSTAQHPSQEIFLGLNQTGMILPYISPVTSYVPEINQTALCTYWHKGLNERPLCWLV